jgi:hypothetical protein
MWSPVVVPDSICVAPFFISAKEKKMKGGKMERFTSMGGKAAVLLGCMGFLAGIAGAQEVLF